MSGYQVLKIFITNKKYPKKSQVTPDSTCIFMSSGHLNTGFVMEFFCDYDHWVVNLM